MLTAEELKDLAENAPRLSAAIADVQRLLQVGGMDADVYPEGEDDSDGIVTILGLADDQARGLATGLHADGANADIFVDVIHGGVGIWVKS